MRPAHRIILVGLVTLILAAHVALWRSDMPRDMALVFTVINAAGWTIVLAPIYFVSRWMRSIEQQNARRGDRDNAASQAAGARPPDG